MTNLKSAMKVAFFVVLLTRSAFGGWFSKEQPPENFLNLETCGGYSQYSCTLQEFSKLAFPENFTRSWEKDGNGNWVLILKGRDVASGQDTRISLVFEKVSNNKGSFANPIRINLNGQDLHSGMIPNVYIPLVEKAGQSNGRSSTPSKKK